MVYPKMLAVLILASTAISAMAEEFVIRPYIQNVTADGATIFWETPDAGPGLVAYGETADCERLAKSEEEATLHRVRITGLAAGSTCHYRVAAGDEEHRGMFRTSPEGAAPVTFIVVGGTASWEADLWERTGMAEHAAQWDPDVYLHTGNMVADGRDPAQWPRHFERFGGTLTNMWMAPVRGKGEGRRNIDANTVTSRERPADMQAFMRAATQQQESQRNRLERDDGFARYHELPGAGEPHATFDWGGTHFVLLSFDAAASAGPWLADHLATVKASNIVVAQHLSIYTAGHRSATDRYRAEAPGALSSLREALESRGVLLDLAGEARVYERTHPLRGGTRDDQTGVTYLTQGGALRGGHPEWYTAVGGLAMDAPVYTVVHLEDTSGWLRTFAWDKAAGAIVEHDYRHFWRDEALPQAVLAKLAEAEGQALLDRVEEIGAMAYTPAVETLTGMLDTADTALRQRVTRALRRIGVPEAAEPLMACLRDPDATVRREAARGIEVAMDPSLCHPIGALALDPTVDPEVRASLLGALGEHAPYYFAVDTAEQVLNQGTAPGPLRECAAWVMDRVATRDDMDTLLSLVMGERETLPLLRIGHALDRICTAKTDLDGNGALAKSARGQERDAFIKAWETAFANQEMRETQQEKREAFEKRRHRWRPATRTRTPLGATE